MLRNIKLNNNSNNFPDFCAKKGFCAGWWFFPFACPYCKYYGK